MMDRVKAKIAAETEKKQQAQSQKRAADDKSTVPRPQQRHRSSQQKSGSGSSTLPASPNPISPINSNAPILANTAATGSPTSSFVTVSVNGAQSFTPQSQSVSSPGGTELIYPFTLGQHTSFGNSPPLLPVAGQQQQQAQLPAEMIEVSHEEAEGTGQFWHSLFGPPVGLLPMPQYAPGYNMQMFASAQQHASSSPNRTMGEFRDPNDMNFGIGGDIGGQLNLDEIDSGLMDWGDFIAQCSQVWVTE